MFNRPIAASGTNIEIQETGAAAAEPTQAPARATAVNAVKSIAGKLSGLKVKEKASSELAHAYEKMRHRRRDFAATFLQSSETGTPIGPPDVARPRYARRTHNDIEPAVAPPAPARIERYDAHVKNATAKAHAFGTRAQPAPSFSTSLILQAARGETQLRSAITDVMPARDSAAQGQAGDLLPALADPGTAVQFGADITAALQRIDGTAGTTPLPANAPQQQAPAAQPSRLAHRLDGIAAQTELTQRLAALPAPPGAAPATHGALILSALRAAGITDPRVAVQVCDRMATLPVRDIARGIPANQNNETTRLALLAMRTLSRGGKYNFNALGALRTASGHPFADETQSRAVHALLGATDYLKSLHGSHPLPFDAPPSAIAAHARGATYGGLALRAFDAASHLLEHGAGALSEPQKQALFDWRQGDRSEGPATAVSKKNHRLQKFTRTTIPRVAATRSERVLNAPKRLVGMDKSPLTAATLGLGGIPRDTLKKEQDALAKAMKTALTALTQAPPSGGANATAPLSAADALTHADPVGSLVELAGLHVWLDSGGFKTGRMDTQGLRDVAQKAVALSANAPDAVKKRLADLSRLPDAQLQRTEPFKTLAGRHFSVDVLEAWGTVAHIPKVDGSPFWTQVDTLRKTSEPPEKKLETRSVQAARDLLVEVTESLKSGSRLRLSDGHHFGLSTRGLSVAFNNALHAAGVPVSAQANLRATQAKDAVVELARSTHGVEIFIGTAERLATHAEAGVFAGYKFDVGLAEARAGGAVSVVFHSGERGKSAGVVIGIERPVNAAGTGYDDKLMLKKAADIVASLFDEAALAATENTPASASQHVFAKHFDDPGISAAWTDSTSTSHSSGISLTGGITFRPPESIKHLVATNPDTGAVTSKTERSLLPVGIGPQAGIAYIRDYAQTQAAPAGNGAIQIEQQRRSGGSRLLGRVGLGVSGSLPVGPDIHNPDGSVSGKLLGLGVLTLDTPAWNVTFRNSRMSARLQLVRNGAQLNHRACTLDREFASASDYIAAVESERDAWEHLFAAEATPAGQKPSAAAMTAARKKVSDHLSNARANWRPSQTLFTRHRLREHAARALDINQALHEQMSRANPDDPEVIALAEANAKIIQDPESYMPIELKGRETTNSDRSYGPNVFLHLATRTGANAQREFVADNVSFATMDRVDRELPINDDD
jgi:hypothetical protein